MEQARSGGREFRRTVPSIKLNASCSGASTVAKPAKSRSTCSTAAPATCTLNGITLGSWINAGGRAKRQQEGRPQEGSRRPQDPEEGATQGRSQGDPVRRCCASDDVAPRVVLTLLPAIAFWTPRTHSTGAAQGVISDSPGPKTARQVSPTLTDGSCQERSISYAFR